jgi:FkbM family methyltransferase
VTTGRIWRGLKRRADAHWNRLQVIGVSESIRNRKRLEDASAGVFSLHLRDGYRVECRAGTTDAQVFTDTFVAQYHLPPPGLRPKTILDLGSNIGTTIIHYARLFPAARVLGVELDAGNYSLCRRNIAALGDRCDVLHGAAWWCDGEIAYGGDEEWGIHVDAGGKNKAPAYSMTGLLDRMGPFIDFVKMDIEGAEAEVLARAGSWIGRVGCLKVEVHKPYTIEACMGDLRKLGIDCQPDWRHPACVVAQRRQGV